MNRRSARTHAKLLAKLLATLLATLALLAACAPGAPAALDLDGSWIVEWDGGAPSPDFAATGAMTLDVDGDAGRFVGLDEASGTKRCVDLDVRVLAGALVALEAPSPFGDGPDVWAYLATRVDADTLRLTNDVETLTLRRRTGAPPVADCPSATIALIAELPVVAARSMKLQAVGSTLYLNTGDDGVPIVGVEAATGAVTSSRTLTDEVGFGGVEPYLFAAESGDRFFGTCRCGRSDRFTHFDLTLDDALTQVETEAAGAHRSIRYGYFDAAGPALVVGGTGLEDGASVAPNRLVSFDPATFAVLGTRDVLPGVWIDDVATLEGQLLALIGEGARFGDLAVVGADGRATETYALQNAFEGYARGIAGVGGVLYVVTEDYETDRVLLYAVELD
jgi:hypothetical protein